RVLDDMARALYREWFVELRCHGALPNEAACPPSVVRVGEAFRTVLGGTPSRANPLFWANGSVPWINSGKVNELRIISPSELITEAALERSAAKLMPRRTTVVAITGATLGQVSY